LKQETKDEEKAPANSLRNLVYSTVMSIEDKVVLEDMINKLSQETDTMLDIINDISRRLQKQLLVGYRALLQSVIDSVDHKLNTL
jgi:hypothetical protein